LTRLTDFSRLLARHASRLGLADHKWSITTSGRREKSTFGGPNPSNWCVAALARCTASCCAPRLPEWTDLTPSKGSIIISFGIMSSALENWTEVVQHMAVRLRTESAHLGGDAVLDKAVARN
jgi:hypothetical protein